MSGAYDGGMDGGFSGAQGRGAAAGSRVGAAPGAVVRRRVARCGRSIAAAAALWATSAFAAPIDWQPFRDESVIEILTRDEDGRARETKIWVVVVDDAAYARTNDSRWLANIRRDPEVSLRVAGRELPFRAEITSDPAVAARVEEAYKAKYGLMQRVMSALRVREPTVLRLLPRS